MIAAAIDGSAAAAAAPVVEQRRAEDRTMAGDYLCVEKGLPMKPQMFRIAEHCQVSRHAVFAAWFRLWRWFDESTVDGRIPGVTPGMCDNIGQLPGFSAALVKVGWLRFADGDCVVCYWDRHFGVAARKRAARYRRREKYLAQKAERARAVQNAKV